jgi:hypothetical protein
MKAQGATKFLMMRLEDWMRPIISMHVEPIELARVYSDPA